MHANSYSRGFIRLDQPSQAMSGPSYDPLPLNADHRDDVPYNAPMSPRTMGYNVSEMEPLEPHDDLPPGAGRPRFMGTALHDDGPQPRQSYADSNSSFPTIQDDYQSSVYRLNAPGQGAPGRDSAFYTLNYHDDPHDAGYTDSPPTMSTGKSGMQSSPYLAEKRDAYIAPRVRSRRRWWIIGGAVAAAIVAGVVVVVVLLVANHHKSDSDSSVSGGSSKGGKPSGAGDAQPEASGKPTSAIVKTGGDGSTVTTEDGTTFTYSNPFGGYWYWDPEDPFNNGARAQSWSPALNETFQYGIDPIRGYVTCGVVLT